MQKHLLLRLLAVLLGFTLVASACGDDDSDSGEAADSSSDSSDDSADDSEDVVEATQDGSVLAAVVARGELNCGVSGAGVGFSVTQPDGSQVGFDADYCRATAAAILGDADAVNFVPLTAAERFTAVQTGQVDVLFRNTTWTQSRDTDVGMDFGPTTYFDGQQLMGRAGDGFSGASGVADIDGAVVCTNAGTTTEKNIADAADAAGFIDQRLADFKGRDNGLAGHGKRSGQRQRAAEDIFSRLRLDDHGCAHQGRGGCRCGKE